MMLGSSPSTPARPPQQGKLRFFGAGAASLGAGCSGALIGAIALCDILRLSFAVFALLYVECAAFTLSLCTNSWSCFCAALSSALPTSNTASSTTTSTSRGAAASLSAILLEQVFLDLE